MYIFAKALKFSETTKGENNKYEKNKSVQNEFIFWIFRGTTSQKKDPLRSRKGRNTFLGLLAVKQIVLR